MLFRSEATEPNTFVFTDIPPETTQIFECYSVGSANVAESEIGRIEVDFKKPAQETQPEAAELTFEQNEDNLTFTATIPEIPNGEYSFLCDKDCDEDGDGEFECEHFSEDNTKIDCEPLTDYKGYVRFVKDDTHRPSKVTEVTGTSPMLTAATPEFKPNGGGFKIGRAHV